MVKYEEEQTELAVVGNELQLILRAGDVSVLTRADGHVDDLEAAGGDGEADSVLQHLEAANALSESQPASNV